MALQFQIVIEPPDTKANWTSFNRDCDDLNSDFLMQPINEADYDSETQACVDARTGGPRSFYDHYVTKRRKKRGIKGLGVEHPAGKGHGHQLRVTPTNTVGFGVNKMNGHMITEKEGANEESGADGTSTNTEGRPSTNKQQTAKNRKQMRQAAKASDKQVHRFADPHEGDLGEATVAALASPTENHPTSTTANSRPPGVNATSAGGSGTFLTLPSNSTRSAKASGKASAPPTTGTNIHPEDFLDVPNKITAAKGALNNAAIRRIACGRNPTPVWNEPTGFKGKLPETVLPSVPVADQTKGEDSPLPTVRTEIVVLKNNHSEKSASSVDGHSNPKSRRGNWSPDQFAIIVDDSNGNIQ